MPVKSPPARKPTEHLFLSKEMRYTENNLLKVARVNGENNKLGSMSFPKFFFLIIISVAVFSPAKNTQAAIDVAADIAIIDTNMCSAEWGGTCRDRSLLPATSDACEATERFVGYCGSEYSDSSFSCCVPSVVSGSGGTIGKSIPEARCVAPLGPTGYGGSCDIRINPLGSGCSSDEDFVGICRTNLSSNGSGCCVPKGAIPAAAATPAAGGTGFTYIPLEKLPGASDARTFPQYIEGLYKFGIWTVGLAALFMISVGGFIYLSSGGNSSTMGTAKKYIWDALIGLSLALLAWLVLNIINPDLVNVNLSRFSQVGGSAETATTAQLSTPTSVFGGIAASDFETKCLEGLGMVCSPLGAIPHKSPSENGCKTQTWVSKKPVAKCMVEKNLRLKLEKLKAKSDAQGITWWVTESWPETRIHKASCHKNATCVDINFTGNSATPENIARMMHLGMQVGLRLEYEVKVAGTKNTIEEAWEHSPNILGVPNNPALFNTFKSRVKVLGDWINGPHFSAYH